MSRNAIFVRIKWIFVLLLVMLLDTLPFPILGFIILYILIFRPRWFIKAVLEIYEMAINDKIESNGENLTTLFIPL
jgi:hypothetical protein